MKLEKEKKITGSIKATGKSAKKMRLQINEDKTKSMIWTVDEILQYNHLRVEMDDGKVQIRVFNFLPVHRMKTCRRFVSVLVFNILREVGVDKVKFYTTRLCK